MGCGEGCVKRGRGRGEDGEERKQLSHADSLAISEMTSLQVVNAE